MWNDEFMPGETGFWQEPDFLLADLVSGFVNKGGMQIGVTLFMKGMVITGTLVSEREYLASLSKMFASQARKSIGRPTVDDIKAAEELFDFTGLTEDIELSEFDGEDGDEDDLEDFEDIDRQFPMIRHLHLKDPVILQPQSSISFMHSQLPIMRVKLTAVDGWMMGKVSVDDDALGDYPPNEIRH
jgi:hypothetical protein